MSYQIATNYQIMEGRITVDTHNLLYIGELKISQSIRNQLFSQSFYGCQYHGNSSLMENIFRSHIRF